MKKWTEGAKAELQRYFDNIRPSLIAAGANPEEVFADIETHIKEDLAATAIEIVTTNDVKMAVARFGAPDGASTAAGQPSRADANNSHESGLIANFLFFLGVALPVAALVTELLFRICAEHLVDPLPNFAHVLLVAAVPAINFWAYRSINSRDTRYLISLNWLLGAAIGIAGFYTLLFLPTMPIGIIGILFGLGLLLFAPLSALLAALHLYKRQKALFPAVKFSRLLGGAISAVVLMLAANITATATSIGMSMALSDSAETSAQGLKWLRLYGDERLVLQNAYYGRHRRGTDLLGFLFRLRQPVRAEDARRVLYLLTGRPFDSYSLSEAKGHSVKLNWLDFDLSGGEEIAEDQGLGGPRVAGIAVGLSLHASAIDSSIDARAGVTYTEWTLEFQNVSASQREARAEIVLPPQGVVSRLTLWVDGEEREAAFAGRAKTQEAYRRVVRTRRDPVLVTTAGPDRIMLQCFPVPGGGRMKVRLGITAPLELTKTEAYFHLPYINEHNFRLPPQLRHSVWIESKVNLRSKTTGLLQAGSEDKVFGLWGKLSSAELVSSASIVSVDSWHLTFGAWTKDPWSDEVVIQDLVEHVQAPLERIVLVLDGSAALRDRANELVAALSKLPPTMKLAAVIAAEMPLQLEGSAADVAALVAAHLFRGGQDNLPALVQGWDLAASADKSGLLWIHGAQPVLLSAAGDLQQRLRRRPQGPVLYTLQLGPGPNRIIEELDGIGAVRVLPLRSSPAGVLEQLAQRWQDHPVEWTYIRKKIPGSAAAGRRPATSSHLARLWAYDEIMRLYQDQSQAEYPRALALATTYQLVTPLSGAVVLETPEQYTAAGLTPVPRPTVPVIPEPEFYLLLTVMLLFLMWQTYLRRGKWQRA